MSIKHRVALIVTLVLAALCATSYLILQSQLLPAFERLERDRAERDLHRVESGLQADIDALAVLTADWASWDDSYEFIQGGDPAFVDSNLVESTFSDTPLSLVRYYDLNGGLVWGADYNPDAGFDASLPGLPLADLPAQHPLVQASESGASGLISFDDELLMLSAQPVLDSEETQPSRGVLIMGRVIDEQWLASLTERTAIEFDLRPLDAPSGRTDGVIDIQQDGESLVATRSLASLLSGQHIQLSARISRDITALGIQTAEHTLGLLLATGAVLMLAVLVLLQFALVAPIARLKEKLAQPSQGPDTLRLEAHGATELQSLASSFGEVLAKKEQHRHELEEQIVERERISDTLRRAAQDVSPVTGESFLLALVRHLVESLPISHAVIGQLSGEDACRVEVVAGYGPDGVIPRQSYALAGVPCEAVIERGNALFSDQLQMLFPDNAVIAERDSHSYAGTLLKGTTGEALGLITVFSDAPMVDGDTVLNTLRVFAARAGAELERESQASRLRKLSSAIEQSPNLVVITDVEGRIEYVNPRFSEITGHTADQAIGQPWQRFRPQPAPESVTNGIGRRSEHRYLNEDGSSLWLAESVSPILDDKGQVMHHVVVQEDVTEQRDLAEKLAWQASHDALTGLLNRREFERRLEQLVTGDSLRTHALCYIDLDQFKVINDTCGHTAGDELLRQLAALFLANCGDSAAVARLGGDEFGVYITDCNESEAVAVAERLRMAVEDFQFYWGEQRFRVGTSIGMVLIEPGMRSLTELLKWADAACFAAKDAGRNRLHLYTHDDHELLQRRGEMEWVSRIADALDEDRLCLYMQPIVRTGRDAAQASHYELLLRLRDRDGQLVPPGAFLPAAERYGLVLRLDRWVVRTAIEWLCDLQDRGLELPSCSINLSGHSLCDEHFLFEVMGLLEASELPGERICFEITETAAIANLARATVFIQTLKGRGCSFALDDFGSGLSSFGYLKQLPVDYLKIDGMFVRDVLEDPIDQSMVRSINEIGHVLGKKTIAEFVESNRVHGLLHMIGVDFVQGYGIARPVPLAAYASEIEPAEQQPVN